MKVLLDSLGKSQDLITYVKDRPGHDLRYAIDATKIHGELGWEPTVRFEDGIAETIQWYLDSGDWLEEVRSGAYRPITRRCTRIGCRVVVRHRLATGYGSPLRGRVSR